LKALPLSWFGKIKINEEAMTDEEEAKSLVSALRKSHRQSVRKSVREVQEYNVRESQRQLSIRKSSRLTTGGLLRTNTNTGMNPMAANPHGSRAINDM
jgi:gluconate kinase